MYAPYTHTLTFTTEEMCFPWHSRTMFKRIHNHFSLTPKHHLHSVQNATKRSDKRHMSLKVRRDNEPAWLSPRRPRSLCMRSPWCPCLKKRFQGTFSEHLFSDFKKRNKKLTARGDIKNETVPKSSKTQLVTRRASRCLPALLLTCPLSRGLASHFNCQNFAQIPCWCQNT